MRDIDITTSDGDSILDELGDAITDQDAAIAFDESVVTRAVWGDEQITAGVFVRVGFDTELRFSDFDIDMWVDGEKWTASEIRVSGVSFASDLSVDRSTIELENLSLSQSALLLSADQIGAQVTVYIGAINTVTRRLYELSTVFVGELTGWELSEISATLNLSGLMARWIKKTMRIAQGSCPWPYKGVECGYSGILGACGQAYSKCLERENTHNFGGFVYLPKLQEKKIYWGRLAPT